MNARSFLNKYRQAQKIDLTDEHWDKISGEIEAGSKVAIHWKGVDGEFDPIEDTGYVFELPFSDSGCYDFFVHIPQPENPGGKDNCAAEWIHLYKLLDMELVKKITPIL